MKNTFLYSILVCLFLLMGEVEVVYGQEQWYESDTWTSRTINENVTINLTHDVKLNGTITINNNCTLTIENKSDNDYVITAIKERIDMFSVKGTLKINGKSYGKGRIIIDGGANYVWDKESYKLNSSNNFKIKSAINSTGTISLKYVTIQNVNDSGSGDGGALEIKKGAELMFCTIQKCYSQRGAAFFITGSGLVKVVDSRIEGCFSGGGSIEKAGGAIRTYGSTKASLSLVRDTLSYNYAQRTNAFDNSWEKSANGGALFWNARGNENTKCTVEGCLFEYNKSDDYGGAIKSQATLEFANTPTIIRNNVAPKGAGLYIEGYQGSINIGEARELKYDLNENLIVENNTSSSYDYNGVNNPGKGAGIHFFFGANMDLEVGSTIDVNMNGATIQNNVIKGEGGLGGGIYFEDTSLEERNYTFNINLNYGKLLNNTSTAYGGGMYISEGNVTSETKEGKEMVVTGNTASQDGGGIYIGKGSFTMNTKGMINENEATQGNGGGIYVGGDFTMMSGTIGGNEASYGDGGGAYINGGKFTMNNGSITNNVVTQGDGGGVFINGGTLSFNKGFITSNHAGLQHNGNGGGICLLNGEVKITDGTISNNESGQYGGGLYVYNSETDEQGASFTGGNIVQNKARYGGGVCVNGNINLEIGAVTVDENTAINGGGVCLLNGAKMDFGQGFIRENKAATTDTWQGGTAYQKSITEVKGIGGGVYLDSNTSLTFSVVNELGLYDNFADYGADDVFANGYETTVSYKNGDNVVNGLPVVSTMKLAGFAVAGEPYWVEDYMAGDASYASGTNKKRVTDDVRRYRTSIQNLKEVYKIEGSEDLTDASKKYLCLAIGHDVVYVTITKKGLVAGESAIFTVKLIKDNNPAPDDIKRVVLLTGNGNESVSKRVALSTGIWEVEETNWTWAYTPDPESDKSQRETVYNGFEFIFENVKKGTLPLHDEAKKENSMSVPTNNDTEQ